MTKISLTNGTKPPNESRQTAVVITWHPDTPDDETIQATKDLAGHVRLHWASIGAVHVQAIGDTSVVKAVKL